MNSYDSAKLDYLFNKLIKNGFYIDIGVRDGVHDNKTYLLYLNGWSGIGIDAHPDYIDICKVLRPNDLSLALIIGENNDNCKFRYNWRGSFGTIFNKELDEKWIKYVVGKTNQNKLWYGKLDNSQNYLGFKNIIEHNKSISLNTLLEKYNKNNKEIDLLNIDVDGAETIILQNFDIKKYNPKYVVIELEKHKSADQNNNFFIVNYMKKNGYYMVKIFNEDYIWANNLSNYKKIINLIEQIDFDSIISCRLGHPCSYFDNNNLILNSDSIELYKNYILEKIKN